MKVHWSKFIRRFILTALFVATLGFFIVDRFAVKYGFSSVFEVISVYWSNNQLANKVKPEEITLLLEDSDYALLKSERDKSIERGIQLREDDSYVPCKVVMNSDTVIGELRLKGHMTDHLEGKKWSFRIKTEEDVKGMYRFSLQDPQTRNGAYEWIYHQLMKSEEIIHLNYDFLQVKLNDEVLGIYAMEEHFGQHVLKNNKRPPGAILRWNPGLYWEWRIDELKGTYLDEQYSDFSSSFAEPYDKGVVLKDEKLIESYRQGSEKLEKFRRGESTTSEIFDVPKMAAFHAIIDLVGGHHSLDWSDLKFFYNSETKLIEPIAYESFSVRSSESIAGQRSPDDYFAPEFDYHALLFADTAFFRAYIKAVERICDESYFSNFTNVIQADLNAKLGILAHEFPFRKFSFDPYYENIELIRHNLELPKPFHAFLQNQTDSTISLALAPVSDFPIEIISVNIDDKEILSDKVFILPAKPRNTFTRYFALGFIHDENKIKNLSLKARILGSRVIYTVEVADYPAFTKDTLPHITRLNDSHENLNWENDTTAYFEGREIIINQNVELAANSYLKILPGQTIILEENAGIFSFGTIGLHGTAELPVRVVVKKGSDGICLNSARLISSYLVVESAEQEVFHSRNSILQLAEGLFYNLTVPAIEDKGSKIQIIDCAIADSEIFGQYFESTVYHKNVYCCDGGKLFEANGSMIYSLHCTFKGMKNVADLDRISFWKVISSKFKENELIASINNASLYSAFGCEIQSGNLGFEVDLNSTLQGVSNYTLYKTSTYKLHTPEKRKI